MPLTQHIEESIEKAITHMEGNTITSHEHFVSELRKALKSVALSTLQAVKDEVIECIDVADFDNDRGENRNKLKNEILALLSLNDSSK